MTRSCIIFDLDGTLIDPRKDLAIGVNLMRGEFGLAPLPESTLFDYVGDGVHKLCERALQDTDIRLEDAIPHMRRHYGQNMLTHTSLYPGVKQGLKDLQKMNCVLAVVTNKPEEFSRKILTGLQVADQFRFIIGGGGAFPRKPAPEAILHLMRETDCPASNTYMVGDHHTDLEAGRRAGIRRIYADWGFGDPHEEQPDFRVPDFPSLVQLLSNLTRPGNHFAPTNSA